MTNPVVPVTRATLRHRGFSFFVRIFFRQVSANLHLQYAIVATVQTTLPY